ncbi:MAG: hypothetical protein U0Q16_25355 [Bryobacteraceae bacterium]
MASADRRQPPTRREILAGTAAGIRLEPALLIPVRRILDASARLGAADLAAFEERIWQQAMETFAACDIFLHAVAKTGDLWRPPQREPVVSGLERGVLNVMITDRIPIYWDQGRGLGGVTAIYRGYHLSMISVAHAHRNLVPFVSVNTCVHEVLHALLLDIFEQRPHGAEGHAREARVDASATRMWLLRDGAAVRESARRYLERLRDES